MRQHLNEPLLWAVVVLAVLSIGGMAVLATRRPADPRAAVESPATKATDPRTVAALPAGEISASDGKTLDCRVNAQACFDEIDREQMRCFGRHSKDAGCSDVWVAQALAQAVYGMQQQQPITGAMTLPPGKKLSRAQLAKEKKAAALNAKPTKFEQERQDDPAKTGGGVLWLLFSPFAGAGFFILLWRLRVARRKYWARVRGEGWEEGRIRARQRAGLI